MCWQKPRCITNIVYLQGIWFTHALYWSFMISSSHTYSARSVAVLDYVACSKDYWYFPICIFLNLLWVCRKRMSGIAFIINVCRRKLLCTTLQATNNSVDKYCHWWTVMFKMQWYELWEPYTPEIDLLRSMLTDICITATDTTLPKNGYKCKYQVGQSRCSQCKTSQLSAGQCGKRMEDHTLASYQTYSNDVVMAVIMLSNLSKKGKMLLDRLE